MDTLAHGSFRKGVMCNNTRTRLGNPPRSVAPVFHKPVEENLTVTITQFKEEQKGGHILCRK
jgi:hypothetical protein